QLNRITLYERLEWFVRGRWRKWLDTENPLAGYAQQFSTRGQDMQPRTSPQQVVGQLGAGLDNVFAVVEHEQQVHVAQHICQRVQGRGVRLFPKAQLREHRGGNVRAFGQLRQRHQARPSRILRLQLRS